jgi:hypothetical protein
MTIKCKTTVENYVQRHFEAICVLENLLEFVQSMPAPDECGHLRNVGYDYTGSFDKLVQHLSDASQIADDLSK